jgi:hypothetical protein
MSSVIQGYQHFVDRELYAMGCPEGTWTGRRLDNKAWGKSTNLILHFTDAATGRKYWLSVWHCDDYNPRSGGLDFKHDAPSGELYELTTNKNKGGFPNLKSARKLS